MFFFPVLINIFIDFALHFITQPKTNSAIVSTHPVGYNNSSLPLIHLKGCWADKSRILAFPSLSRSIFTSCLTLLFIIIFIGPALLVVASIHACGESLRIHELQLRKTVPLLITCILVRVR